MNWLDVSKGSVVDRYPLSRATTFRIGGPARFVLRPRTGDDVAAAMRVARDAGLPVLVAGMGSNLLVADEGLDALVVLTKSLQEHTIDGTLAIFQGGVTNARALQAARRHGLGGLECLVGYPGTLGGAVRMNAGGAPGYIGEHVEWVVGVDADGRSVRREREACGFRYRGSDLADLIVTEVALRLPVAVRGEFAKRCAAIHATKAASQPLALPSAGCFWKNPSRVLGGGKSAGLLVQEAGCKGLRVGGAEVSPVHGNFIVNMGGATAANVLALADEVRRRVRDASGVVLEREVIVWERATGIRTSVR
jgi:UDP-N-acetylmuramate dehydrogenase